MSDSADTTHSNEIAAVLRGMYAAEIDYLSAGGPGRASFDLLAPFFSPDVVLEQAEGLPYGGTWRGHEGLERFFLAMSATWESFLISDQRILTTAGPAVVLTDVEARAAATGRELSFSILQTLEVEGGRIKKIRPFYWDTAAIAEATGHPSSAGTTFSAKSSSCLASSPSGQRKTHSSPASE